MPKDTNMAIKLNITDFNPGTVPKMLCSMNVKVFRFAARLIQGIDMQIVYKNCYTFISVILHICEKFNLGCMLKVSLL